MQLQSPTHHTMRLHPGPIEDMRRGVKKSELRLNDEKRKLVKVGDTITFSSQADASTITVRVTSLETYPDFRALYQGIKNDYPSWEEEAFVNAMYSYYSPADEKKYGAIEIGIAVIPIDLG